MKPPVPFPESPTKRSKERDPDNRIRLHGVSWEDYERILEIRGKSSGVRIAYLEGELELMSPSRSHESIKKMIARLLEAHAEETGRIFQGYGSWTIKERAWERGVEPDECYTLSLGEPKRPDLAIEVIWTSGGLDKLEIYRGLGVREVWVWKDERITVHTLEAGSYVPLEASCFLPDVDLVALVGFLERDDQTQTVREYRAWLRSRS